MQDVREVYEMITQQKPPEPGALERQQKRQVRSARNKKIGALAVAAAIGVLAIVLILRTHPGFDTTTPATGSTSLDPIGAAEEVATSFLGSLGRTQVALPDGTLVVAQTAASDASILVPDTAVRVEIAPNPVFAVAPEAESSSAAAAPA